MQHPPLVKSTIFWPGSAPRRNRAIPTKADKITEAWVTFETDAMQGLGHIRLSDPGCRTLLTTAQDIRGRKEHKGRKRGPDACKGRKALVVGANNTSHYIWVAMWQAGVDEWLGLRHAQGSGPARGASCATRGNRGRRMRCGSMAATCTSHGRIRNFWRSCSRHGSRAFQSGSWDATGASRGLSDTEKAGIESGLFRNLSMDYRVYSTQ